MNRATVLLLLALIPSPVVGLQVAIKGATARSTHESNLHPTNLAYDGDLISYYHSADDAEAEFLELILEEDSHVLQVVIVNR